MEALGIGSKILNWCRAYLRDRVFQVKVGSHLSEAKRCTSGVPQGSCLGPLLFAIFAQDLRYLLADSMVKYKLYADDLKLYHQIRSQSDKEALEKAIDSVHGRAKTNGMAISTSKCAVLKTDKADSHTYHFDHVPLPVVDFYKDLGVIFDSQFKFREHVVSTAKSASKLCSLILRAFIIPIPDVYINAYKALVVPKWTYCSHVWYPCYQKDENLLQAVQNRFLKSVSRRCNVQCESIDLPPVRHFQQQADLRILKSLLLNGDLEKYFIIKRNNLRSGVTLSPKAVAHYDVVNNCFPWRVCKATHLDATFSTLVSSLFK